MYCFSFKKEKKRKENGMSRKELAKIVGYSKSAISEFERGNVAIPDELISRLVKKLNWWRLAVERCQDCESNIFTSQYLDAANDDPVAILCKLKEEFEEGIEAINELLQMKTTNAEGREDLTDQEFEKMMEELEQIYDVSPGVQFAMLVFAEKFDALIKRIILRNKEKIAPKWCIRKRKQPLLRLLVTSLLNYSINNYTIFGRLYQWKFLQS